MEQRTSNNTVEILRQQALKRRQEEQELNSVPDENDIIQQQVDSDKKVINAPLKVEEENPKIVQEEMIEQLEGQGQNVDDINQQREKRENITEPESAVCSLEFSGQEVELLIATIKGSQAYQLSELTLHNNFYTQLVGQLESWLSRTFSHRRQRVNQK